VLSWAWCRALRSRCREGRTCTEVCPGSAPGATPTTMRLRANSWHQRRRFGTRSRIARGFFASAPARDHLRASRPADHSRTCTRPSASPHPWSPRARAYTWATTYPGGHTHTRTRARSYQEEGSTHTRETQQRRGRQSLQFTPNAHTTCQHISAYQPIAQENTTHHPTRGCGSRTLGAGAEERGGGGLQPGTSLHSTTNLILKWSVQVGCHKPLRTTNGQSVCKPLRLRAKFVRFL
jgi:hypothetical protein